MPAKKPVVAVVMDDDLNKRIEDFQFTNRFRNKSSAVVFILRAGMKALAAEYPELDESVSIETGKKPQNDGVADHGQERIYL